MSAPLPRSLDQVDPASCWERWEPDSQESWEVRRVNHLLRRAAFGATPELIQQALREGPQKTIDRLLEGDPSAAARGALIADTGRLIARNDDRQALAGWWIYAMLHSGHPLREKLTLMWHNHFATSDEKVNSRTLMVRQNQLIRRHALGKFEPFLQEMSRDPAMLLWLDSNSNVKAHPNENYAREVMELFALGVGNYTETDIREAARAFTGWHTDASAQEYQFNADLHDDGIKTVLGQTGPWNGDDIIRLLLEQPAAGRFLVGKLYRELVSEEPPPEGIIESLAEQYRSNGYDTGMIVRTILESRLFFSDHAYRKRVKSPVEFVLGAVIAANSPTQELGARQFANDFFLAVPEPTIEDEVPPPPPQFNPVLLANLCGEMGQALFAPPNVKGWRGGRDWLNDSTLLARANFAASAAANGRYIPEGSPKPDEALRSLASRFLDGNMPDPVRQKLRQFLGQDQPDGQAFEQRLREATHAVLCLPQYQLA